MDGSDREDTVRTSDVRQVLGASFIGTAIEWYDFFIYGTAATLVFGQLFFSPDFSPLAATLSSVATFAVGWMVTLCLITLVCVLVAAETFRGGEFSSEQRSGSRAAAGQS